MQSFESLRLLKQRRKLKEQVGIQEGCMKGSPANSLMFSGLEELCLS